MGDYTDISEGEVPYCGSILLVIGHSVLDISLELQEIADVRHPLSLVLVGGGAGLGHGRN